MENLTNDQTRMQKHWIDSNEFSMNGYEATHMERRKYFAEHILETNPKSILEIGCFGGYNLRVINEIDSTIELTGFDINPRALEFAKSKLPSLNTVHGSIYELDKYFNENEFDVVFTSGCLIHIPNGDNNTVINGVRDNLMNIAKNGIYHLEHDGKDAVHNHIRWTHDFKNLYKSAKSTKVFIPKINGRDISGNGCQHVVKVQL